MVWSHSCEKFPRSRQRWQSSLASNDVFTHNTWTWTVNMSSHSTQATINELIAGSFGGAAQVLVGQPLDTIKTRAQIAPSQLALSLRESTTLKCSIFGHRGHVRESTPSMVIVLLDINHPQERAHGYFVPNITQRGFLRFIQRYSQVSFDLFWAQNVLISGMLSPLLGIAGVNSLLFAAYGTSQRIISPFPNLSLKQIAAAGTMAGAANAILASPGKSSRISSSNADWSNNSGNVQSQDARTIRSSYG